MIEMGKGYLILIIIIIIVGHYRMRKKYDNPAPLTVNFAFDTRLLDLVANTYQKQPEMPTQPRWKRSLSQKTPNPKFPLQNTLIRTQTFSKQSQFPSMTQSLPKLTLSKQKFTNLKKSTSINASSQYSTAKLRIVHLHRNTISDNNIDRELTKNMIKTIRKNILSTNITPTQLFHLQTAYQKLKQKFHKSKQT